MVGYCLWLGILCATLREHVEAARRRLDIAPEDMAATRLITTPQNASHPQEALTDLSNIPESTEAARLIATPPSEENPSPPQQMVVDLSLIGEPTEAVRLIATPQSEGNISFFSLAEAHHESQLEAQLEAHDVQRNVRVHQINNSVMFVQDTGSLVEHQGGIANNTSTPAKDDVVPKTSKLPDQDTSIFKIKVSTLIYNVSAMLAGAVVVITVWVLVKAFFFTPDVNPQDPEKLATDEELRWDLVHLLALLCLHMKISTSIVVAAQDPLQERLKMNLFDYNTLLACRCIPGLLASLVAPSMQYRFGSAHSLLCVSFVYAFATLFQTVAIGVGSYWSELFAAMCIEGANGAALVITSAVCSRLVHGDEQSHAVTIVSIYTVLGMATPLVILPWMLEYADLGIVAGIGSLVGGLGASLSAFAFFHVTRGGLSFEESFQAESEVSIFSSDLWNQRQALCLIVAMSLTNGVAITLGENVTKLLADSFNLKQAEVALVTFVGIISVVGAQIVGVLLDTTGYRPVASIVSAIALAVVIVLAIAHSYPVAALMLWGIGYSINLNAGFSSFSLIVPAEQLSVIMGMASTGQQIGFITIPLIYGYGAQYHGNLGFISLLLLLAVSIGVLACLSAYNCSRKGASLFGTQGYNERASSAQDTDVASSQVATITTASSSSN